jgi:hypothetical protein
MEQVTGGQLTGSPSGKQRQKKLGRGRPTPSLMASVRTAVMSTENRSPGSLETVSELRSTHSCRTKEQSNGRAN